ncbi:hypothetical protein ES705_32280 [subsurface metagenome]
MGERFEIRLVIWDTVDQMSYGPRGWITYLATDDADEAIEKLEQVEEFGLSVLDEEEKR